MLAVRDRASSLASGRDGDPARHGNHEEIRGEPSGSSVMAVSDAPGLCDMLRSKVGP